jgi:hypothetical protein
MLILFLYSDIIDHDREHDQLLIRRTRDNIRVTWRNLSNREELLIAYQNKLSQ